MAGATTPAPAPAAAVAEAQITAGPAPEAAVGALAAVDAAAVSVDGAEPATPAPAAAQAAPPAAVPAAVPAPQIQGLQAQPVAPAAAPAPAAPPAPLLTQVAQPLFSLHSAAAGDHVMTLSVTPENLGPVTVRAHVSADGIRVELFAPNDAGREALRSILTDLRRDLSGSGLSTSLSLSAQDQPGTGQIGRAHV